MNIWILQHYATPPDTISGSRHFNFAKQLITSGHSVKIWAAGFNHSTFREERLSAYQLMREDNIEGVCFVWLKTLPYTSNDWRRMANIMTYSFMVSIVGAASREKPDVIWSSNPHLLAGLVGYLLAILKGSRFVFEVRDLWPQIFVDLGVFRADSLMTKSLRKLEKFIYNKAETIITLMPKASQYLGSMGIPQEKIVHIPHAVDFQLFSSSNASLPKNLENAIQHLRSQGKILVGYIGAHGLADGLETIVDAAKILQNSGVDNVHILLVGRGTEKEFLVRRARDFNLENIDFFDSIPKTAVPEFIKNFDMGIVCKRKSNAHKYGISFIKLFDYMACAKPIIWSVDSQDDPVKRTRAGLSIEAESPEQMAIAIQEMAEISKCERKKFGDNGYNYVVVNHRYDMLSKQIEKILMGSEIIT